MHTRIHPPILGLWGLLGLGLLSPAAHAIDFAQADWAGDVRSLVVVKRLAAPTDTGAALPLFSASYVRWKTGEAAALGAVKRYELVFGDHQVIGGAGVGINHLSSGERPNRKQDLALSARLQLELQGPAPGGRYYMLGQASSFRGSSLWVGQYSIANTPVSLEMSLYHEQGYRATSAGMRIALGDSRWSARLGTTRGNGEQRLYVGISYNGF